MVGSLVILGVFVGVGLLVANGFFLTLEYALTRLRQFPQDELHEPRLRRAWEMTDRLEIYLSSSKLGITITSIGLGVVTEPALSVLLDPIVRQLGLGTVSVHALSALIALVVLNLVT